MVSNNIFSNFTELEPQKNNPSVLIVGADSQIGDRLSGVLEASGNTVLRTTRRQTLFGEYFIDLNAEEFVTTDLPDAQIVVLCAGISTYAACSQDPASAARVNVVNTIKLARRYLQDRHHVIFISSAAALGEAVTTTEAGQCSPTTVYGALKRATELALEAESKRYSAPLTIVRLTKVVSRNTQFIKKWMLDARANEPITAFNNRLIAPISLDYVCKSLNKIVKECARGTFHLSGDSACSYFEFARQMARLGLLPEMLIRHIESSTEDRQAGCFDKVCLDMPLTTSRLSIQPQSLRDLLQNLYMEFSENFEYHNDIKLNK